MELWNAIVQRIDHAGPADIEGSVSYAQGATVSIEAVLDGPNRAQILTLGLQMNDVDATLYIEAANMPDGVSLADGDRVLVQPWNTESNAAFGSARLYQVVRVTPLAGGHLSHYQAALKGV